MVGECDCGKMLNIKSLVFDKSFVSELTEMIIKKERKICENGIRAEIYKGKIINQFYGNYGEKK